MNRLWRQIQVEHPNWNDIQVGEEVQRQLGEVHPPLAQAGPEVFHGSNRLTETYSGGLTPVMQERVDETVEHLKEKPEKLKKKKKAVGRKKTAGKK
jgi:hypothetical protein